MVETIVLAASAALVILGAIFIKKRYIKRLEEEIDWQQERYSNLADAYTDHLTEFYINQRASQAKRRGPGRPKGSKNKPKNNVKPTTRKYTRKSSK